MESKIFNEDSLLADVVETWGYHGAHADVLSHLIRRAKDADFLSRDAEPMERRYRAANAEVDALRQLVRDFINDACPVIGTMDPSYWAAEDWRRRAQRAMAGIPIAEAQ